MAGYSIEDIKDKTPNQVLGKELGNIVKAGYRRCVEAKAPTTYEEHCRLKPAHEPADYSYTCTEDNEVKYLVGSRQGYHTAKKGGKEREELFNRLPVNV